MSVLREEPYNLVAGQTIIALVEAKNIIGFSVPSDPNIGDAELRTEPLSPTSLVTRVEDGTTDTEIKVYYELFTDKLTTGGSPLISLDVWYDQGIGNWVSLQGADPFYTLDDSFVAELLTPGHYYKFKYRGINIFGEGAFSAESILQAASKPDQIATPSQLIVNTDLRVTWTAPNKRGSEITVYNVYVKDSTG